MCSCWWVFNWHGTVRPAILHALATDVCILDAIIQDSMHWPGIQRWWLTIHSSVSYQLSLCSHAALTPPCHRWSFYSPYLSDLLNVIPRLTFSCLFVSVSFAKHFLWLVQYMFRSASFGVPGTSDKLGERAIEYTIFLHGLAQQWRPQKKRNLAQT